MICRACKHDHPSLQMCSMARRIREASTVVVNSVTLRTSDVGRSVTAPAARVTEQIKLTRAEIQRSYRLRHRDAVLAADRARKRLK